MEGKAGKQVLLCRQMLGSETSKGWIQSLKFKQFLEEDRVLLSCSTSR